MCLVVSVGVNITLKSKQPFFFYAGVCADAYTIKYAGLNKKRLFSDIQKDI